MMENGGVGGRRENPHKYDDDNENDEDDDDYDEYDDKDNDDEDDDNDNNDDAVDEGETACPAFKSLLK